MIVASSMTLLADSRNGQRSGLLPWTLWVIGSTASLAANVAVAEPCGAAERGVAVAVRRRASNRLRTLRLDAGSRLRWQLVRRQHAGGRRQGP